MTFNLKVFLARDFVQVERVGVHKFHHLGGFLHHKDVGSCSQLFPDLIRHNHQVVLANLGHIDRIRELVGLSAILFIGGKQLFGLLQLNANHGFQKLHESLGMLTVFEEKVDAIFFFLDFYTFFMHIVL